MLTYVGRGYTPAFVDNYDAVVQRLGAGEIIELVEGPDDICTPLLGFPQSHCHNESVTERDRLARMAVGELLGPKVDLAATFSLDAAMLRRLRAAFSSGHSREACGGCEWSGLCDAVASSGFAGVRLTSTR